MQHSALRYLLFATALGLSACDSVAGPDTLPLTVQAAAVTADHLGPDLSGLSYQITNTGHSELFLGSCDHQILVAVEREKDGSWSNVSAGVCQTVADMTPIRIAPGATLHGVRSYEGPAGRYRLLAYGYSNWEATSGVTLISNIVVVED